MKAQVHYINSQSGFSHTYSKLPLIERYQLKVEVLKVKSSTLIKSSMLLRAGENREDNNYSFEVMLLRTVNKE